MERSEQPLARRHGRRTGLRIFFERPWFSSGADELLRILLAPGGDDTLALSLQTIPASRSLASGVAIPPGSARRSSNVRSRRSNSTISCCISGLDDRPEPGRPVTPPADLPLASLPQQPTVTVVGYRPQYNQDRGLWYVDVAIDPGPTFWPFVRLALCRYQPDSITGCHLSAPVRCDYVQLVPERTTSVSRTDERRAGRRQRSRRGSHGPRARPARTCRHVRRCDGVNRQVVGEAAAPRPGNRHRPRLGDGRRG